MSSSADAIDVQSVNSARNEYLIRLHKTVTPFVIAYFREMYASVKERLGFFGSRRVLEETQRALKDVPGWNSGVIAEKTRAIEAREPALPNIIAATFVGIVKILSSIRLSTERPRIKLKVPETDRFVHMVYKLTAKKLYQNPELLRTGTDDELCAVVFSAVESAVRDMIPMSDILPVYLANTLGEDKTINAVVSPPGSEQGDDDDDDGFEEEMPDPEPPKIIEYGDRFQQPSAPPPSPLSPDTSSIAPSPGLPSEPGQQQQQQQQPYQQQQQPYQQQQQPYQQQPAAPQPLSRPLFPDAAEGDAVFG